MTGRLLGGDYNRRRKQSPTCNGDYEERMSNGSVPFPSVGRMKQGGTSQLRAKRHCASSGQVTSRVWVFPWVEPQRSTVSSFPLAF